MTRLHSLFILFLLVFTYSCGDDTAVDKLNDIKTDASNFEDGVSTAIDYNDGVISEISLLDLKMMALNEQAEKGVDDAYPGLYEECLNEYQRVSGVIRKVAPAGIGGADFKISALAYIDSYGVMLEYFTPESITEILEQMESDELQTMEELNYIDEFFKAMQDVDQKFDMLSDAQQVFAKRNDSYVKKDEVDLEEIYEETK